MAASTETKAIDPSGDVLLKVGSAKQMNLLMSSRALSFASPVFAAMFNGRFAEAQSLSSSAPREIPMPDDDAIGMEMLCNIAHLRVSDLPSKIENIALADFAILCDKYSCVEVVRSYCRMWMIDLLEDTGNNNFEKLLFAAYVLDLPHEFHEVTKVLIRDHVNISFAVAVHDANLFPVSILNSLQSHRLEAVKNINAALIAPALKKVLVNWTSCQGADAVCGQAMREFWGKDLFPVVNLSLPDLRQKVVSMPSLTPSTCPCQSWNCVCKDITNMKTQILEQLDECSKSVRGLCLDCVKSRVTGKKIARSKCRVAH